MQSLISVHEPLSQFFPRDFAKKSGETLGKGCAYAKYVKLRFNVQPIKVGYTLTCFGI